MHPAIPISATAAKTMHPAKAQGPVGKVEAGAPFVESLAASLGVVSVPNHPMPKQAQVVSDPNVAAPMKSMDVVKPAQEIVDKVPVVSVGVGMSKAVTALVKASGEIKTKAADVPGKGATPVAATDAQVVAQAKVQSMPDDVTLPAISVPAVSDANTPLPVAGDVPVAPVIFVGKAASQGAAPIVAKGHKEEAKKVEAATSVTAAALPTTGIVAAVEPVARHEAGHGTVASDASGLAIASATTSANHALTLPSSAPVEKHVEVSGARPLAETGAQATDLRTMTATPNVLEIGLASGSHGWLRVRAELGPAGEVAASVVASSTSAAEGLHKELPAISAYLAEERVGVGSLVVNAMEKGAGAQDSMLSGGSGGASGSQPGPNQRGRELNFPSPDGRRHSGFPESESIGGVVPIAIGQTWMTRGSGSGGWVNVRV